MLVRRHLYFEAVSGNPVSVANVASYLNINFHCGDKRVER